MSLSVDLITPEERRSASAINVKSLSRIGAIILPTLIIFAMGHLALKGMLTSSRLRVLESRWESAEPKQKQSLKLSKRLHYNMQTATELDAWKTSRIEWHQQLRAVMETAPTSIQATMLVIAANRNAAAPASPPTRKFTLNLEGKTSGERAMLFVESFKHRLETHPATTGIVEAVAVANYGADISTSAGEFDRVFRIECQYRKRPEETTQ